jgi:hypothetical protein
MTEQGCEIMCSQLKSQRGGKRSVIDPSRWTLAHGSMEIPAEMRQSCEPGLMCLEPQAQGLPALAAAQIAGDLDVIVRVAVPSGCDLPTTALVRVRGIRLGHAARWPRETEDVARSNEAFYASATAVAITEKPTKHEAN